MEQKPHRELLLCCASSRAPFSFWALEAGGGYADIAGFSTIMHARESVGKGNSCGQSKRIYQHVQPVLRSLPRFYLNATMEGASP